MPDFKRWLLNAAKFSNDLPQGEFTWSPAKHFLFKRCLRAWYFRHYLAQGGWDLHANDNSMQCYLEKHLTTFHAWIGNVLESAMASALSNIAGVRVEKEREEALIEEMQIHVSTSMITAEQQLSREEYLHDPKKLSFAELHYQTGEFSCVEELLSEAYRQFRLFFELFTDSHLPRLIVSIDPLSWHLPPEHKTFYYHEIPVSLRPWIFAVSRKKLIAFEFRSYPDPEDLTGFSNTEDNTESGLKEKTLATWTASRYREHTTEIHSIRFSGEGLFPRKIIPSQLNSSLVGKSAKEMLKKINHGRGVAIEQFPCTEKAEICLSCHFRGLCSKLGR